ncbi:hypothetical protein H2248_002461 [Termitomyces sp. 'cryptogamus']|nr:hypothetical protein H2248_002461 [Termitomyces sp. 'cryptogamus']
MRINVLEEGSQEVIWYKERFLSDDEIVEHVVHNPSSTICWTIHRPSERGWYIRIRAPSFPPGVFIPFIPVPKTSPHYSDAAMSFSSRTSALPTPDSDPDRSSISSIHSYPPTSPPVVQAVSPKSVHLKFEDPSNQFPSQPEKQSTQVTQFVLTPHSTQVVQPTSNSFFARTLSVLKNSRPSHSNSFTLSRLPASAPLSPPPSYSSSLSSNSLTETPRLSTSPALSPPLLVFHDRTPILTVGTFTGLLEIDQAEEQLLGVETSFWIAIALTYLEFLEDRESYLAALSD